MVAAGMVGVVVAEGVVVVWVVGVVMELELVVVRRMSMWQRASGSTTLAPAPGRWRHGPLLWRRRRTRRTRRTTMMKVQGWNSRRKLSTSRGVTPLSQSLRKAQTRDGVGVSVWLQGQPRPQGL
jgi:hypothetical protein